MIGCEFCVDLGSQICRNSGLNDQELLALPQYRQSELFTERERLALDYTVGVMRTPVDVTDELFSRMKEHFSNEQLVEITALLMVVNLDRFNAAFGVGPLAFRGDGLRTARSSEERRPNVGGDLREPWGRTQVKYTSIALNALGTNWHARVRDARLTHSYRRAPEGRWTAQPVRHAANEMGLPPGCPGCTHLVGSRAPRDRPTTSAWRGLAQGVIAERVGPPDPPHPLKRVNCTLECPAVMCPVAWVRQAVGTRRSSCPTAVDAARLCSLPHGSLERTFVR